MGRFSAPIQYRPTNNTRHYTYLFVAVSGVQGTPGQLLAERNFGFRISNFEFATFQPPQIVFDMPLINNIYA
jgi:hypothetical protein